MTTTAFVLLFMIAVPLSWEVYTLTQSDLQTISQVWAQLGREWSPFVAYGLSVLVGHFFIRPDRSPAATLPETGEVAVVLWLGWVIFIAGRAFPQALPLGTAASFGLVAAGVTVGAYFWTMGV